MTYAKGFYISNTWTALNILLIDRSARFLSGWESRNLELDIEFEFEFEFEFELRIEIFSK